MVTKLSIGSPSHWLKWDGFKLDIQGKIRIGGLGTDDEIYFKDSGLYMYDFLNGYGAGYKGIALKYSTYQFFDVSYNTSAALNLRGSSGISGIYCSEVGSKTLFRGKHGGYTVNLELIPSGASRSFYFYGTGSFQLPSLTSSPAAHVGDMAYNLTNNRHVCFAGGQWKHFDVTSGW